VFSVDFDAFDWERMVMHWKRKAMIQNVIARLPAVVSYNAYYILQRTCGGLRRSNPTSRLRAGVEIVDRIRATGASVEGKTFFEVGTGRALAVPMALWLCGADQIITADLNPYLTARLVNGDIAYLKQNAPQVIELFGEHGKTALFAERFEKLANFSRDATSLLRLLGVTYLAPADAASVDLPDDSIDYHVSFTVLEHIPPNIIVSILKEGKRLLRSNGLFVHCIDFTDHFSHSDPSISAVNFLQFSEQQWDRYAGNRYMYQNRLRVDEFSDLIEQSGVKALDLDVDLNRHSLSLLSEGSLKLDPRFRDKSPETNAASAAWLLGAA
jgi:SAM-dependent methyltransferase